MMSSDEAIQLTNNDATNFKAYAVSKGYWSDIYLPHFAPAAFKPPQQQQQPIEHKPPEMSRGYFARVNAIRSAVNRFLEAKGPNCQIVNLGCGFDTLFFELCDHNLVPKKYVELDFSRVVTSKIRLIKSKKALSEKIWKTASNSSASSSQSMPPPPVPAAPASSSKPADPFKLPALPTPMHPPGPSNEISAENYFLSSCDLRSLPDLERKLSSQCGLDLNLPTLFIAECVLVYMTSEHSSQLLAFLSRTFRSCALVSYEQVNLSDKFGSIMLANMEMRSCKLLGVDACQSMASQRERFERNGFGVVCQIMTMSDYYRNKMDEAERRRIESIEFLDETELLFQLMDHYCICVVGNNAELSEIVF